MTRWKWLHTSLVVLIGFGMFVLYSKFENDANNSARALRARATSLGDGIITARHIWDHNRTDYDYVVEGKTYTTTTTLAVAEPSVGQHLGVHYNPNNPVENYTDEDYPLGPKRSLAFAMLVNLWPGLFLVCCALAIRGLVEVVRWRKRRVAA